LHPGNQFSVKLPDIFTLLHLPKIQVIDSGGFSIPGLKNAALIVSPQKKEGSL